MYHHFHGQFQGKLCFGKFWYKVGIALVWYKIPTSNNLKWPAFDKNRQWLISSSKTERELGYKCCTCSQQKKQQQWQELSSLILLKSWYGSRVEATILNIEETLPTNLEKRSITVKEMELFIVQSRLWASLCEGTFRFAAALRKHKTLLPLISASQYERKNLFWVSFIATQFLDSDGIFQIRSEWHQQVT